MVPRFAHMRAPSYLVPSFHPPVAATPPRWVVVCGGSLDPPLHLGDVHLAQGTSLARQVVPLATPDDYLAYFSYRRAHRQQLGVDVGGREEAGGAHVLPCARSC